MRSPLVNGLRAALALLILGAVLVQVLVWPLADEMGRQYSEVSGLAMPYAAAVVVAVAFIEAALVFAWHLVTLAGKGAIFTARTLASVKAIQICGVAAAAVFALTAAHLLFVVGLGGPGVALALIAFVVCGVAFALLMNLLRRLLVQAVADRSELDEVI